jgi:hypothetical protein
MRVEPDDVKYRFSIYNISLFNVLQIRSIYFINLNITMLYYFPQACMLHQRGVRLYMKVFEVEEETFKRK